MLYLKIEDEYFFSKEGKDELCSKYNTKQENICFARDKEVILNAFEDGSISYKIFIAPYLPELLDPKFSEIFDVIRVENKFGLLTKRQKEEGITPIQVLKDKLKANVYNPTVTFDDYIIDKDSQTFKSMISALRLIKTRTNFGITSRGYFLTGVPGTGKTFFAKCIAGELDRSLIELNLSFFINSDDTFGMLNKFFDFFKYTEGNYVVLIDEIEKMFNDSPKAKQVLGYLLTVLNEYQDKNKKNKADVLFIATANNVTELVKKNPELFRKGRFDLSIYLTAPTESKATDTFDHYISKHQEIFKAQSLPMVFFMIAADPAHKFYNFAKESRLGKIIDKIKEDAQAMEVIKSYPYILTPDKNTNEQKTKLFEHIKKSDYMCKVMDGLLEEYKFELDTNELVCVCFSEHRDKMLGSRSEFPYVPAEIESMISELFSEYYFGESQNFDLRSYVRANTPLQISMSEGILAMNGATENFTKM
ncbi:ATP-binding protein [Campylobacter sp. RM16188]|uniref:ATP-binding protein n=1 Tax=Campylobacter sp. RM16188 TaxID=1705725 RepID=UPI001551AE7E|nr:ATP-binding protein [Campylobacter sp. RM16188]